MSSDKPNPWSSREVIVGLLVTLITFGAIAITVLSASEKLRIGHATAQLLGVVGNLRTVAHNSKNFNPVIGEDLLSTIEVGLGSSQTRNRTNPWAGGIRLTSYSSGIIRLETDVPVNACRKLSLYVLEQDPADLGLLGLESKSGSTWQRFYTATIPASAPPPVTTVNAACGTSGKVSLAMMFRI